jgi:hypothetical protein
MRRREIRCNGKGKAHRTSTGGVPSEQGKMRFLTLKSARPPQKATSNQTFEWLLAWSSGSGIRGEKTGLAAEWQRILAEVRDHQIGALFSTLKIDIVT